MPDTKLSDLTAKSPVVASDLLYINDVPGGPESKSITGAVLRTFTDNTQAELAGTLFPASELEQINSIDPISRQYQWGNGFRYMTAAQISDVMNGALTLDVTTPFNNAINSGHRAFMTGGIAAIADTVVIDSSRSLSLNNSCTLQRIGASVEPVVHLYGNAPVLNSSGYANIINDNNSHQKGIILCGPDPAGGVSDVPTRGFTVRGLKVFGPVGTVEDGSPGIYVHSLARTGGGNTSVCYKGDIINNEIRQCDVGLEFSTDGNSHFVSGLYVTRWINAAVWFNASYGNVLNGVKFEFAEIAIVPDNTKRYAIEFNKQNSGVETDTDAGYFADGALDNSVVGYAELTNGTGGNVGRNMALVHQNEDGTLQGSNDVNIVGTLSGGIGFEGLSTDTAVGTTNRIVTVNGVIDNRVLNRSFGYTKRNLKDGSGEINFKGSTCWFELNNDLQTSTATQQDLFTWDNIEDAGRVPVTIELEYTVKVSGTLVTQGGKVVWKARLFSNTSFDDAKSFDDTTILPLGGAVMLTPTLVLAAGTDTNTMKATVGFLTGATGTQWIFTGSVKLMTTSIEGSKVDWDDDLAIVIV